MIKRAIDLAKEYEQDLVEIAPTAKPPVCRIMDYSKFKYDQEKKERRIKKNQTITHLKQIRLKPHIGDGDFKVKLKQAMVFLNKKDKVKINMVFRGREMAHRNLGQEILERMVKEASEISQIEKPLSMEGRIMTVILAPKAEK